MTPDIVNGMFELLAAVFIMNHCRVLYAHKEVRGVSLISTAFFTSWGLWNLFYYPGLGQTWSFVGGLFVVTANAVWLWMMYYYSRRTA